MHPCIMYCFCNCRMRAVHKLGHAPAGPQAWSLNWGCCALESLVTGCPMGAACSAIELCPSDPSGRSYRKIPVNNGTGGGCPRRCHWRPPYALPFDLSRVSLHPRPAVSSLMYDVLDVLYMTVHFFLLSPRVRGTE